MMAAMNAQFYLNITCPDRPRIVSAITSAIAQSGGNILDLRQHTSIDLGVFFFKARFNVKVEEGDSEGEARFAEDFASDFGPVAQGFAMEWKLSPASQKKRVALLVSKTDHCLYELLLKHRDGELDCELPLIVSNHGDLAGVAAQFGIPFFRVDPAKGKADYEAEVQNLLLENRVDLVVMARYMQILSSEFTAQWREKIINIHHGFLPAFKGAKPYHQAWYKGVKLIGATAHFANEELDQGPIIAQDVLRVPDTASIAEFVRMGKDIERKVLLEALRLYLSHSVFVRDGRTFVLR